MTTRRRHFTHVMHEKIAKGEVRDVWAARRLGPYFVLSAFEEDKDYADSRVELWVWSIARADRDFSFTHDGVEHLVPAGTILASLGTDLYMRDGLTCLFLR